jgi:drug/metabolite transporter (DMT)-like permease
MVTKDIIGSLLMGVVGYGLSVYFITQGALHTKLINVAVIYSTVPFFTFFYSFVLLSKKPKSIQLLLLLFSFVGVAMVSTKSLLPQLTSIGIGELFVLLSAVCGAWYVIGRKLMTDTLNNYEISLLVMSIAFITTFSLALINKEHFSINSFSNVSVICGLLLGAGLNIVATLFENFGYKHLEAVFANQLLLSENVFALLFGYLFYQEIISFPEIIGSLLILMSVYITNKYINFSD